MVQGNHQGFLSTHCSSPNLTPDITVRTHQQTETKHSKLQALLLLLPIYAKPHAFTLPGFWTHQSVCLLPPCSPACFHPTSPSSGWASRAATPTCWWCHRASLPPTRASGPEPRDASRGRRRCTSGSGTCFWYWCVRIGRNTFYPWPQHPQHRNIASMKPLPNYMGKIIRQTHQQLQST